MKFPQFRKYKNQQSYFKILSTSEFVEYKLTAKQLHSHRFEAKILPDRNYISDMLHEPDPYWEKIDESEFQQFIDQYNN
jgi:hypothetical protein